MPSYTKREGPIREAKARERVRLIESAVVTSLDRRSFLFFGTTYRKDSHELLYILLQFSSQLVCLIYMKNVCPNISMYCATNIS